jgi:hypothetical protein
VNVPSVASIFTVYRSFSIVIAPCPAHAVADKRTRPKAANSFDPMSRERVIFINGINLSLSRAIREYSFTLVAFYQCDRLQALYYDGITSFENHE